MTKKHVYKMKCVYAGRRHMIGDKFKQCFILEDGEKVFYSGIKGVFIGGTYKCNKTSMSTKPEWLMDIPRVENTEWEIEDERVTATQARKRAEAKTRKSCKPTINKLVGILKPLLKDKGYLEVKSIVEAIVDEAYSGK